MEILLIRHGKTKGNVEKRYIGRTDEPLLESSKAELANNPAHEFHPDLVYISPMLRCRQTAELLFGDANPVPQMIIWDGFQETDFGEFEYLTYEDLNGHPAYQAGIDSGGLAAFPGGESGKDFRLRCQRAFAGCIQDAQRKKAQKIVIVVHGGTIMSIMERYAVPKEDFYHWQVKNGGGFLVRLEESDTDKDFHIRLEQINLE